MEGDAEMPEDRRRERRCPSCGGTQLLRARRVDGWSVTVPATEEGPRDVRLAPFADVCYDCGMVTLFVRIADAR